MELLIQWLNEHRGFIHIGLHILLPLLISRFSKQPGRVFFLLMSTMLVDLDHLLANPIYDPARCSIGFHPLHTIWVQPIYIALTIYPKTRWIGLGLVLHMFLDLTDCIWMKSLA
ncbi:hypothetical protein EP331_05075 [bacterium]|nr:MAG: hypothetical protein EP331_05075 [bacterium]